MPINTCLRCGKEFKAATKRAKFCPGVCYRAKENEYTKRARASWSPDRKAAQLVISSAIYSGTIVRLPCEVCGATRQVDAHHDDYSKPTEVRWLCRSHHRMHHARYGRALNA